MKEGLLISFFSKRLWQIRSPVPDGERQAMADSDQIARWNPSSSAAGNRSRWQIPCRKSQLASSVQLFSSTWKRMLLASYISSVSVLAQWSFTTSRKSCPVVAVIARIISFQFQVGWCFKVSCGSFTRLVYLALCLGVPCLAEREWPQKVVAQEYS
jgi:hypothetical protein